MSIYKGTTLIAGISTHTNENAHSLFDFKWTDHKLNDVSWLEASIFSWQSGDVYTSAYNHLAQDIQGITSETETVGSYTVTFYRATDGHKICLADQEQTVLNIYNFYGIAWYYILDTTNTQFKLPRTKYGFEGLRTNVGDKIDESLPNIKGEGWDLYGESDSDWRGAFSATVSSRFFVQSGTANGGGKLYFNASNSSSTYQDNAPVQERATQMYLYFYVGDYSQTAIEQTAGLNSELFNGKADTDLSNVPTTKAILTESYNNSGSWYRVYSDGWCEQGGVIGSEGTKRGKTQSISFAKPFRDRNYTIIAVDGNTSRTDYTNSVAIATILNSTKRETGVSVGLYGFGQNDIHGVVNWVAYGYIS